MKRGLVQLIAGGLYSGASPIVPGTTGSIPPWLIAWFLLAGNQAALGIVAVLTVFVSVWAAGEAERFYGHDAKKIVIDEWAGMFLTLLFVPYSLVNYLIGFAAFRAFDVVKIPPAAQAERLPRGWGVTMDDVVAGVQANILTQIVVRLIARSAGA
ncbi:MAG TPA: phosphatidylglycerophosphatase A [candidate division Zixibacteria bacterium]|nr:phosphatidylglycerophosphatase A [candidate division Zixibacteria bacterium]MDD4916681.1 phosphatidylglycerophosphatase A [candidate division Zixibacteria bacterium]MDM7973326.1 phosphatidylglycerophosphatase A [candidate division Zixibacteria bacterium]HOD67229.1 phosphatidylglycerophosphatase A [candidate division Zixibacteria bacterium]HPC10888.1 phosphatidylglycerophosphatase A [candidate division Zixibacteria bacterium]